MAVCGVSSTPHDHLTSLPFTENENKILVWLSPPPVGKKIGWNLRFQEVGNSQSTDYSTT